MVENFIFTFLYIFTYRCVSYQIDYYAPINGLPQDGLEGGGGGLGEQPTGIRLREAHVGGDFDIHNDPRTGWEI